MADGDGSARHRGAGSAVVSERFPLTPVQYRPFIPLNHSGNPGVSGVSHSGLYQRETLGVGLPSSKFWLAAVAGHLAKMCTSNHSSGWLCFTAWLFGRCKGLSFPFDGPRPAGHGHGCSVRGGGGGRSQLLPRMRFGGECRFSNGGCSVWGERGAGCGESGADGAAMVLWIDRPKKTHMK